jgi:hypothetical protein
MTVRHAGALDNWTSPVTDVNAVSMQTIANGSSGVVAYTFNDSGYASNGIEISIDFGACVSPYYFYVADFDMRATPGVTTGQNNSPPTPELRPVPIELAYCQRYFASTFGNGVTPAQNAGLSGALGAQVYGGNPGELYTYWQFPVQMRANPTITTYSPSQNFPNWYNKTSPGSVSVSVDPDGAIGLSGVLIGSHTTPITQGDRCYIHATASAEL